MEILSYFDPRVNHRTSEHFSRLSWTSMAVTLFVSTVAAVITLPLLGIAGFATVRFMAEWLDPEPDSPAAKTDQLYHVVINQIQDKGANTEELPIPESTGDQSREAAEVLRNSQLKILLQPQDKNPEIELPKADNPRISKLLDLNTRLENFLTTGKEDLELLYEATTLSNHMSDLSLEEVDCFEYYLWKDMTKTAKKLLATNLSSDAKKELTSIIKYHKRFVDSYELTYELKILHKELKNNHLDTRNVDIQKYDFFVENSSLKDSK